MDILKHLKDGSIIICENNYKKKILKELTNQKLFFDVKFYSKKEFFNKYLFSYDEKTIHYLVSNYNIKCEIAKMKLDNLYYIEDKDYVSNKLNVLKDLKKELIDNNLLYFDEEFKNTLINKNIIVIGYEYLEKYEEEIFSILNALIYNEEGKYNINYVYEFNDIEDEINYVAKEIYKLILYGVDINNIKIAGVSSDYYNALTRTFKLYGIPIKLPSDASLYSTNVGQVFLKSFNSDITKSIEAVQKYDSVLVNKIINICNKYTFVQDYNDVKPLIEYDLKHTKVNNFKLKNYVEVVSYNEAFCDNDYVFLMNFNIGQIPMVKKDEDYITDNIKGEVSSKKVTDINKEIKKYIINKLKTIKNLVITYKLRTKKEEYYPSFLIRDLECEVKKKDIDICNSYSFVLDKINYAKKIDNYLKYGELDDSLSIYGATYPNFEYNTYDNSYQKVDKNLLKEYLNNKLVLSYTSLNNYNKCAFRYYLANILKLDKYEENFEAFIGSIFHDVLEKCFIYNLNVADEINNYIKDKNKVLTIKERFFVNKVIKDIEFVINTLKKQNELSKLNESLYEKEISIDKSKDDMNVSFLGFVDKILYKQNDHNTLVSIIDYKTGFVDIELKYVPYGLSLQLPIYLYLVKNSNLFVNPKFIGFYLQYILDKDIPITPGKEYESLKEDNLKLMGYSTDDISLLEWFDESYANSKLIKGMKTKVDGNFSATAKVLNDCEINKLIDLTENNVDAAIDNILDAKFDINPKKIGYLNDVGCQYCKFKDICYKKESDYVILEDIKDLSFLGGDEDA